MEGKGESEASGGGFGFSLKIPGRGSPRRGGRGVGRVSAGNSGGGVKYFLSGPKFPPSFWGLP